ncbi:unnamed protein product [Spodoptera littoralis]|uniref:Uncharacterized protein n=1 Tax=Spodoptera littoralis TaxID=7109 RepID=A0A9P0I1T0_SPOLI|nr:unnamed protein product [Spodoptera littoralis]CAH1639655.1 unnamed protein product [Spodoptera littoralis]
MVCYKYEDCGPPKGKPLNNGPGQQMVEDGEQKKSETENQLKRTKSRELRGGIMYYSCHCIKRNGLQHDCRRTGCGGEPACLVLPDPLCAPSQLARARGLADPAVLAAHTNPQGSSGSGGPTSSGSRGKRFIVCELKGIIPDAGVDRNDGKCCKCPNIFVPTQAPISSGMKPHTCICTGGAAAAPKIVPPSGEMKSNSCKCTCGKGAAPKHNEQIQAPFAGVKPYACICPGGVVKPLPIPPNTPTTSSCPCKCKSGSGSQKMQSIYDVDENTLNQILQRFESKELKVNDKKVAGSSGRQRDRDITKSTTKEECTRPGCVHWQPPPPCVWDLPCKADCFETPASAQPGRNPLRGGGGGCFISSVKGPTGRDLVSQGTQKHRDVMKILTPECCTGCSAPRDGGAMASGGPAVAGLPMLVMKLC